MRTYRRRYVLCVFALLAMGWQTHANAQEVTQPGQPGGASASTPLETGYVDLMAGLGYTDNAFLAGRQRTGDGIATAGLNVDYKRLGKLSLNLLGDLNRIQYVHGSFGGSFYGHFIGSGVLGKPTDLLQWQLHDTFGEAMTNPLAGPTPVNLQTINDVSTGPLVNLHFGLTNRLTMFGLYSRTTYQRSPFDSQTYQGGTQFLHALSGASSVSLSASIAHTKYVESAAVRTYFEGASSTYDIGQASISYDAKFVRTDVLLTAGYSAIRFGGAARHGAPLYSIRLNRRISPFSTVFVGGAQRYSTNGTAQASAGVQAGLQVGASLSPGFAVAQPFNERSADAGWQFNRARTNLSLTGTYRQMVFNQTSVNNDFNHQEESIAVVLGRQLRRTMGVQLLMQGYWDRYSQLDAKTRSESIQLTFSKRLVRTMVWFYIERWHQSGSPGRSSFLASSYNDDRVGIYVTYDLFGERPMQPSLGGMPGMGGFAGGY